MAILSKKEEAQAPVSQPMKSRPEPKPGDVIALLGHGSEFEGKLTFKGTVRIDGKFKGEIFSDSTLIVGDGAEVRARVDVGSAIVHGSVIGDVSAINVIELHSPARVYGKLITPNLVIDKGVIFQGECQMENIGSKPKVVIENPEMGKLGDLDKKPSSVAPPVDIGD